MKNVIFERYVFGRLKQEEGDLDSFITKLREKAAPCKFAAIKDKLVRDKLDFWITDEGARRRMLREENLKLDEAVRICCASEVIDAV